jgi:hypothetical protein
MIGNFSVTLRDFLRSTPLVSLSPNVYKAIRLLEVLDSVNMSMPTDVECTSSRVDFFWPEDKNGLSVVRVSEAGEKVSLFNWSQSSKHGDRELIHYMSLDADEFLERVVDMSQGAKSPIDKDYTSTRWSK